MGPAVITLSRRCVQSGTGQRFRCQLVTCRRGDLRAQVPGVFAYYNERYEMGD